MTRSLTQNDILKLFNLLNEELKNQSTNGELYLVGGAVMCIALNARKATQDVDAYFLPAKKIRQAAAKVAKKIGVNTDWINDAVKGFLSEQGQFDKFLELSNLKIYICKPDYLLAMKCLAFRIGEEFHDLDDIRYLLRYLNISHYQNAIDIISQYYPLARFPQKTLYALKELLNPS